MYFYNWIFNKEQAHLGADCNLYERYLNFLLKNILVYTYTNTYFSLNNANNFLGWFLKRATDSSFALLLMYEEILTYHHIRPSDKCINNAVNRV